MPAAQQAPAPQVPQPEKWDEIPGMMTLGDDAVAPAHPPMPQVQQPAPQMPQTIESVPQTVEPIQQTIKPTQQPDLQIETSIPLQTMDSLELSQSSINTSEEAVRAVDQHLDQVYTPSADQIVQRGDEDRMPTILFDEDMTKQLEDTLRTSRAKQNPSQDSQDPGSIKISK